MLLDYYDELTRFEHKDMIKAIYQSAIRLQHTLEQDLLYNKLTQIEKDQASIESYISGRTENADSVIKEIAQKIGNDLARSPDISLDLEGGDVQMSRKNIEYICTELFNNAIKFSMEGSQIEINSKVENDSFMIVFTDNGIGIKKEFLENIGPFMQFDRSNNEQQGRGLGLFLVNKIVNLHKGKLKIESDGMHGTTAIVWIPTIKK